MLCIHDYFKIKINVGVYIYIAHCLKDKCVSMHVAQGAVFCFTLGLLSDCDLGMEGSTGNAQHLG